LAGFFLLDLVVKVVVRGWQFERGLILFNIPVNLLELGIMFGI
jgi:hypothetical protein